MKPFLTFAAATAITLVTSTATAQETGTLIPKRAAQIDARGKDAARIAMEQFSVCVVSRSYARAAKIIDMPVDTPAYGKQLKAVFDTYDECLSGGELHFNEAMLRGTLFQAFYARDFKGTGPVKFDPSLQVGYWKRYSEPLSAEARSAIALENFGECVVRSAGPYVKALISVRAGSWTEDGAFNQLVPAFGPCVAQGNAIKFSKPILKGVLAEALYRMSVAAGNETVSQ